MKIEHIAIWATDLEQSRAFYTSYFNAVSGKKYENATNGFSSYFLTFGSGCRLEIMHMETSRSCKRETDERLTGISHFAVSTGAKKTVDELTEKIRADGFRIASNPRVTGDGYYESVVLDPDGNRVEITV